MNHSRRTFPFAAAAITQWGHWVFVMAGIAGAMAPARADLLPPATTLAHCTINSSFVDDPTSCTLGSLDTASASLTVSPFVGLTAQSFSPAMVGLHGASATADLTYSFQVVGGNVGDIVPLLISTTLETLSTESVSSRSYGFAELNVNTSAAGFATLVAVCTDGTCGTTATSFSGTLSTRARSGGVGDFLNLHIATSASGTGLSEFASASADPFIFVDPAFANASLYQIVVSPGVGNAPFAAVPEPASAALFSLGLLLCAAGQARRRAGRALRGRTLESDSDVKAADGQH